MSLQRLLFYFFSYYGQMSQYIQIYLAFIQQINHTNANLSQRQLLKMWRIKEQVQQKSKICINNLNRRFFQSPKHENSMKTDYNSYMMMQKFKKIENNRQKVNKTIIPRLQTSIKVNQLGSIHQLQIVTHLLKQNDYLLDEVIRYKQEISIYKQKFGKIKRCKSEESMKLPSTKITIVDQQNFETQNIIDSKIIKLNTEASSGVKDVNKHYKNKEIKTKKLANQSLRYINPSKKTLSYQIQQLDEKLCRLIEKLGLQKDLNKRKQSRLDISNCVQQLKNLRKSYEQLYS